MTRGVGGRERAAFTRVGSRSWSDQRKRFGEPRLDRAPRGTRPC